MGKMWEETPYNLCHSRHSLAQPAIHDDSITNDTLPPISSHLLQGKATIFKHAVSEDGHIALLKNSCVSTHMREFSVVAKTDEPARDAERKQVSVCVSACGCVCGINPTYRLVQLCSK
jgi:hypothetical protein